MRFTLTNVQAKQLLDYLKSQDFTQMPNLVITLVDELKDWFRHEPIRQAEHDAALAAALDNGIIKDDDDEDDPFEEEASE